MLLDLLSAWGRQVSVWILLLYKYIFPEYPKIGLAVFGASGVFLIYYLVRGKAASAFQIAASTLITLSFMLYAIHWLIKLYRIAL